MCAAVRPLPALTPRTCAADRARYDREVEAWNAACTSAQLVYNRSGAKFGPHREHAQAARVAHLTVGVSDTWRASPKGLQTSMPRVLPGAGYCQVKSLAECDEMKETEARAAAKAVARKAKKAAKAARMGEKCAPRSTSPALHSALGAALGPAAPPSACANMLLSMRVDCPSRPSMAERTPTQAGSKHDLHHRRAGCGHSKCKATAGAASKQAGHERRRRSVLAIMAFSAAFSHAMPELAGLDA